MRIKVGRKIIINIKNYYKQTEEETSYIVYFVEPVYVMMPDFRRVTRNDMRFKTDSHVM